MRNLVRNESVIHYALYAGTREGTDADNLYTGERIPTYSAPITIRASVSAARGTADLDLFGVNVSYTKSIIVDDMACPIDEHSILWIGKDPESDPHNYEVVAVAKSLNHITYAVKEVHFANEAVVSG